MAEPPPICKFYVDGQCRFGDGCRNSHAVDVIPVVPVRKPKKSKAKSAPHKSEEVVSEKLPSMKTARDVIRRIQWDEEVPSQHITVGYLDRFVGVVEQAFDTFDWTSDLGSVDLQNVLAIPQHRIQYFKYRGKKLWDKNERLDLVFGSTSSDKREMSSLLRDVDEELLFSEDLVSNSDEGMQELEIGSCKSTHFLAVRIDDAKLLSALQDTVADLTDSQPTRGTVAPELYHCTLALLCLDSADKVAHCASVLKAIGSQILRAHPESLVLKGLATFRDRVLLARVLSDFQLVTMVQSLMGQLRHHGVQVVERPPEFHVSLIKGHKYVRELDQNPIIGRSEELFGQQPLGFVHLCALREAPDLDGFYRVVTSVDLSEGKSESQL